MIENVRVRLSDHTVIESARIVLKGGRITAIGAEVDKPLLSRTIDGGGGTVTPGLVDVGSAIALDRRTATGPIARAWDGFDRYDVSAVLEALAGGVTTVCLVPSGHSGILGTASIVRLSPRADGGHGELVRDEIALCLDLGSGDTPLRRLNTLNTVRKQFTDAVERREALDIYEEDLEEYTTALKSASGEDSEKEKSEKKEGESGERKKLGSAADPPGAGTDSKVEEKKEEGPKKPASPPRRPDLDLILRVIDRELPLRVTAHRSADIRNAIELAREFDLDLVLVGASEAHLVLDEIAAAKATVIVGPLHSGEGAPAGEGVEGGPLRRSVTDLPARLTGAKIPWHLASGSPQRELWWRATRAVSGTSRDAVGLVTRGALSFLGISGRVGTGGRADLVIWSADPASDPDARVMRVFIGGRSVYTVEAGIIPEAPENPPRGEKL